MSTLEEQIKAIADEAFDHTEPIDLGRRTAEPRASVDLEPVVLDARRSSAGPPGLLAAAAAVLIVALVGGLLIATGRDSDPSPADDPDGLSVVGVLSDLPIDIETQVETVDGNFALGGVDLAALERVTGIERPATLDDSDAWVKLALGAGDVAVPPSELFRDGVTNADAFADEMPFSALDVGGYVSVDVNGGGLIDGFDVFSLIGGTDGVRTAVGDDNLLKVGDGEPGERSVTDRTPLRPIGQPLLVGFDPERETVAVGRGADLMSAWLDDAGDSLMTSSTGVVEIAEQLDRLDGLVSFIVLNDDFDLGELSDADVDVVDDFVTIDRPFSRLGIGSSGIDASWKMVYVYAFADTADAAAATPSIEDAFAADNPVPTAVGEPELLMGSFLDVDSIEAVGRTVVVITRPSDAAERSGFFLPAPIRLHR